MLRREPVIMHFCEEIVPRLRAFHAVMIPPHTTDDDLRAAFDPNAPLTWEGDQA